MADKKDTGTPVDASVGETSTPDLANTSESLDKKSPSDKTGDASESNSILATAGSDILSKDEEGSPTKGENDENGEARKDEEGGQRRDPLRSKRIPYVNPDRYKTGGPQRVCFPCYFSIFNAQTYRDCSGETNSRGTG